MKALVIASHSIAAAGIRSLLRERKNPAKAFILERGEQLFESVAEQCLESGVRYSEVRDPNDPRMEEEVREIAPEVMFAFGAPAAVAPKLLPVPTKGVIGLHACLLQDCQGLCPVRGAILDDRKSTGVTMYRLETPDRAQIVGQERVWIEKNYTALSLYQKLSGIAEGLFERSLDPVTKGGSELGAVDLVPEERPGCLEPGQARIDWSGTAWQAYNLVRAMTRPYTGAFSFFMDKKMVIWKAAPDDTNLGLLHPGEIEAEEGRVLVGAKFGALRLDEIEWNGKLLKGEEIFRELGAYWREKFK